MQVAFSWQPPRLSRRQLLISAHTAHRLSSPHCRHRRSYPGQRKRTEPGGATYVKQSHTKTNAWCSATIASSLHVNFCTPVKLKSGEMEGKRRVRRTSRASTSSCSWAYIGVASSSVGTEAGVHWGAGVSVPLVPWHALTPVTHRRGIRYPSIKVSEAHFSTQLTFSQIYGMQTFHPTISI